MVPTCLHFSSKNPPKSLQKPILKGIDFLIDFDIDFKTAQEGPKTAQDGDPSAKTAPRGPQDGPKMAPRGPKSWDVFSCFFDLGRQEPPRAPRDPSKTDFWFIFDRFLVDFRWFCVDFWSIFHLGRLPILTSFLYRFLIQFCSIPS